MTIDLRHADSAQIMRALVAQSDIIIENFVPGHMHTYGFDYEACRDIRPDHGRAAYDQVIQGLGGVMRVTGPMGGYTCLIDINQVSVLDVIEVIEGPTDTVHCVLIDRQCNESAPCAMHGPWSRARFILLRELGTTALGSIQVPAGTRVI